jgi:hypothetical protein
MYWSVIRQGGQSSTFIDWIVGGKQLLIIILAPLSSLSLALSHRMPAVHRHGGLRRPLYLVLWNHRESDRKVNHKGYSVFPIRVSSSKEDLLSRRHINETYSFAIVYLRILPAQHVEKLQNQFKTRFPQCGTSP